MVSNFLLVIWLTDVKHILLLRVREKGIRLKNNRSAVNYMSLCRFTSSSGTYTRSPVTGIGFFLVVFTFKFVTLLPHILWSTSMYCTITGKYLIYCSVWPICSLKWWVKKRCIHFLCLFSSLDMSIAVTFLFACDCVDIHKVFVLWVIVL